MDEISVRLKNVQMVFGSFATFFILLGGLVILTHMAIHTAMILVPYA
jgi:hypothetical protein